MGKLSEEQKLRRFLSYINNPLSNDSISLLYDAHNVIYEKCDLFSDFTETLMTLMFRTYLGDDCYLTENDKVNHFKWCWESTVNGFEKEGIYFGEDINLFDYYLNFAIEIYYTTKDKTEALNNNVVRLWKNTFNYRLTKTRSEVESFLEVYKMFDKTLQNAQNRQKT